METHSPESLYRTHGIAGEPRYGQPLGMRVLGWLTGIAARMARKRELRRQMHALDRLNDRLLRDIGLSRFEIEVAAREGRPPRRPPEAL